MIGWEVIHVDIVWSDLSMMYDKVMFSRILHNFFLTLVPIGSELFVQPYLQSKSVAFP